MTLSASVKDNQSAACWVAVTRNAKLAFTSNTASANISSYMVKPDGTLALIGDGNAGATGDGSKPIDIALDRADKHLYSLNAGNMTISAFDVKADGSLVKLPTFTLPEAAVGLAAR